jgi:hypothetical protein
VVFFVTVMLAVAMSYPVMAPLFQSKGQEGGPSESRDSNSGLIGWLAIALLLILSMGWWLARSSIAQLAAGETVRPDHRHIQERGGQIAMWADFHAEVARVESGEVRIYLTDSYNRPIAARYFDARILPFDAKLEGTAKGSSPASKQAAQEGLKPSEGPTPGAGPGPSEEPTPEGVLKPSDEPRPAGQATPAAGSWRVGKSKARFSGPQGDAHPTIPALDDSYRFARMDRKDHAYRIKVLTPGWSVTLKFTFDGKNGRRSLPIWCGTRTKKP